MWMAKLREIDDNFCWNIYTSIEKVNKMWWALRIFFFFFFYAQAYHGFYLHGRCRLGRQEIVNNFLRVLSFKHGPLRSTVFQERLGDTLFFQEMLLHDDSHDKSMTLYKYFAMKLIENGDEKILNIFWTLFHCSLAPQDTRTTSCAFLLSRPPWGSPQSSHLPLSLLNFFLISLEESAWSAALNKQLLCSSADLKVFQPTCHLPSVKQSLVVLSLHS